MQASTALPPSASTRAPACAVIGCPAAIAPLMREPRRPYRSQRKLGGDISSPFRRRGRSPKPVATTVTQTWPGEPLVDRRAEDDVRVVTRPLADDLGRLVHLVEREVVAAGDREQDALGADDVGVDERRAQRALDGLHGAVVAGRVADAHERVAGVLHDRAHVGEVEVDQAGHRDQVADALDALAEHVVGDPERVEHRRRLVEHLEQPLVRDDDHRVAGLAQRRHAVVGGAPALRALEAERHRDDADRERAELAGDLGDDRAPRRSRCRRPRRR